jgi:hypothetical protein
MTTRSSIRVKPLSSDWIRSRSFRSMFDLLAGITWVVPGIGLPPPDL